MKIAGKVLGVFYQGNIETYEVQIVIKTLNKHIVNNHYRLIHLEYLK